MIVGIICAMINCILGMWIWFRLGKQNVIEGLSKDLMRVGKLLAYNDMLIEQLNQENEHLKKMIDENADKSNQGE